MRSILIKNAYIVPMHGSNEVLKGDIYIENSIIKVIGAEGIPETADDTIEANGMVAMPGLINCHNHAGMVIFRGYSDDLRLMEWLNQKIWPAEAKLGPDDIYWATMLAIAEMLRSGTTTFADMYFSMDHVARAVDESGIRASLSRGVLYSGGQGTTNLDESEEFVARFHGGSNGRITCMFGPHAPFTCPPDYLLEVIRRTRKYKLPIHIHLAETSEEVAMMFKEYHKSPTKYLYDLGLFEHHALLAHAVHLSQEDVYLLKGLNGGISHNPVSNMNLGCGVAPVLLMRKLGITVGIGTDGAGSATTLDMFEEMKAVAWMHKNQAGDPTAISADNILRMATIEGAKVLGISNEVGSLEVGKKADIILVDLNKPELVPVSNNIKALLAYSATGRDVHTSIIDGRIVVRNREIITFGVKEVMHEVEKIIARII